METLCRKCGNELNPIKICMHCNQPFKWKCIKCKNPKESIHNHVVAPFVMAQ